MGCRHVLVDVKSYNNRSQFFGVDWSGQLRLLGSVDWP
ncbi:MAG: hypothetical protein FD144_5400 [Rhodospirillaceae bacterium]|nr:MAG: hypothetical protein FD144_5400 [Rhodospirillaceae bacterium]